MVLRAICDLLLPRRCPACGAAANAVWCGPCLGELAALALPDHGEAELDPRVRAVGAYAYEGVVRDSVLAVKVAGQHAALAGMGALMRARLPLPEPSRDCGLTWVPTSRRRVRERGVDVPRTLAGRGAMPLLRRVRETRDQTDLPADARWLNPRGAFEAVGAVPPAVVLVDDVRTTGATALAAASALIDGGARRVLVATFAVAPQPGPSRLAAVGGRAPPV